MEINDKVLEQEKKLKEQLDAIKQAKKEIAQKNKIEKSRAMVEADALYEALVKKYELFDVQRLGGRIMRRAYLDIKAGKQ